MTKTLAHGLPKVSLKKTSNHNSEATSDHTLLLRMALSLEYNRAYWENYRPERTYENIAKVAFEERWFGNKSMSRIRLLLNNFRRRFDAYPQALNVLCKWRPTDARIRQNICHWHLQLSDPIYRDFTGEYLVNRREHPKPRVDRNVTARWLADRTGDKWSVATLNRVANNLLSSAAEAGLLSCKPGTRTLTYPHVDDMSLAYLLYLLRNIDFKGSLLSNLYLISVGLSDGYLEQRLRRLPGLNFSRMGDLQDFNWTYSDLENWANHMFSITLEDNT